MTLYFFHLQYIHQCHHPSVHVKLPPLIFPDSIMLSCVTTSLFLMDIKVNFNNFQNQRMYFSIVYIIEVYFYIERLELEIPSQRQMHSVNRHRPDETYEASISLKLEVHDQIFYILLITH